MSVSTTQDALYFIALLYDAPARMQGHWKSAVQQSGLSEALIAELIATARRYVVGTTSKPSSNTIDAPLRSILEGLGATGTITYKQQYQKQPLAYTSHFFPTTTVTENSAASALWQTFEEDIAQLKDYSKLRTKAETLLHLLHRHTVTLTEPTGTFPYVSYYDYAKSLAGFVVSLHSYLTSESRLTEGFSIAIKEQPIRLLSGDISGVQDFLYDIVGRSAAKSLKGRSFYLQLLSTSILQRFLDDLDLYEGNVIYDSGGSFNLIVPNTEAHRQKIKELKEDISNKLFKTHRTGLSLVIADVPVYAGDLLHANLPAVMRELHKELEHQKSQKLHTIIAAEPAKFFDPKQVEEGGGHPRDVVTGEELRGDRKDPKTELGSAWYFNPRPDEDTGMQPRKASRTELEAGTHLVAVATAKQIILGKNLREVDYWISTPTPLSLKQEEERKYEFEPCALGVYNYLIPKEEIKRFKTALQGKLARILAINEAADFVQVEQFGANHQYGFVIYGGNDFPSDDFEPFTFSELAGQIDTEKEARYIKLKRPYTVVKEKLKRLGVLRMDVDNLGHLFRDGLGETVRFVEYSTLSRSLDYFFKGYLNTIWASDPKYQFQTQIIYSGGDDLFIIGRWSSVIDFAKTIKADFQKWVCGNEKLTISGGMAMVPPKFPIVKAAYMAGDAEQAAKTHSYKEGSKNSFDLLGVPMYWGEGTDWENEFALVEKLKERLSTFVTHRKLSRTFLQKIQTLYSMSLEQARQEKNESWKWIIAYDFARAKQEKRRDKAIGDFLDSLQESALFNRHEQKHLASEHDFIALLNAAARWAELETKTK